MEYKEDYLQGNPEHSVKNTNNAPRQPFPLTAE